MELEIHDDSAPLRIDDESSGVVRIGPSRVTLDVFMTAFEMGNSAEAIAHKFPTVSLADAYATVGYYFRHREEVDEYLRWVRAEGDKVVAEIKARQEADGFWERLKERQRNMAKHG